MSDGFIIEIIDDTASPSLVALDAALGIDSIGFWMDVTADPYIKRQIAQRFSAEGGGAAGQWAELADATVASREAQGYPGEHPILIRTGEMEKYLETQPGNITAMGSDIILDVPGEIPSGKLGTRIAVHQLGSAKNSTPARPFLAIDDGDAETLVMSLSDHLMETLRGGFL